MRDIRNAIENDRFDVFVDEFYAAMAETNHSD
jgi:queuine/archaeosine tRNA-ribosyltransferase